MLGRLASTGEAFASVRRNRKSLTQPPRNHSRFYPTLFPIAGYAKKAAVYHPGKSLTRERVRITPLGKNMKLVFFLSFVVVCTAADTNRIMDAVHKGLVTKSLIDSLTPDDVPEKWRSEMKDESKDRYYLRTFYRGGRKVLTVMWAKDWVEKKSKMFVATIYDGEKRVYNVPRFEDNIGFSLARDDDGYEIYLVLKDSGELTLTALHSRGFFESVIIDGRDTHIIDDLSYAKQALAHQHITLPLIGAIKDTLEEERPNK